MLRTLFLLLMPVLAACQPGSAPAPDRPPAAVRDAEAPRRVLADVPVTNLDALARCFHRAVSLLQAEPARTESLSAFFARAQQRASSPLHGCFAGVRRNAAGAVVVGEGAVVTVTRGASSHSSFEGGRSELAIPYRFTAAGVPGSASTIILRSFGGAP